jgi:hypothetical protein
VSAKKQTPFLTGQIKGKSSNARNGFVNALNSRFVKNLGYCSAEATKNVCVHTPGPRERDIARRFWRLRA